MREASTTLVATRRPAAAGTTPNRRLPIHPVWTSTTRSLLAAAGFPRGSTRSTPPNNDRRRQTRSAGSRCNGPPASDRRGDRIDRRPDETDGSRRARHRARRRRPQTAVARRDGHRAGRRVAAGEGARRDRRDPPRPLLGDRGRQTGRPLDRVERRDRGQPVDHDREARRRTVRGLAGPGATLADRRPLRGGHGRRRGSHPLDRRRAARSRDRLGDQFRRGGPRRVAPLEDAVRRLAAERGVDPVPARAGRPGNGGDALDQLRSAGRHARRRGAGQTRRRAGDARRPAAGALQEPGRERGDPDAGGEPLRPREGGVPARERRPASTRRRSTPTGVRSGEGGSDR